MPKKATKPNKNQKTALIQQTNFHCWVYSSKKIQLCSFQLSWKIPFLFQHSNGTYWMLSVQPPHEQLRQNMNKKIAPIKKKSFYCWVYSWPVKRFNFAHSNFPGKFLFSYNTVIVYTWCYQCSPPEQLKQNTNQKTALIQKNSFYCWVYSSKKFQLCSFQLSWKIPFVL